jgi:hypothetical protein
MDKRMRFGLATVLLITGGFGLGWLARGRVSSPVVPSPPVQQPSDQSGARIVVSVAEGPVLQYEGNTLEAALAGANKLGPSKALSDRIVVDDKHPLFGTLSAKIAIDEIHRSGGVSVSPHYEQQPVRLVLVRKSRDAMAWELTPEAVASIKGVKD